MKTRAEYSRIWRERYPNYNKNYLRRFRKEYPKRIKTYNHTWQEKNGKEYYRKNNKRILETLRKIRRNQIDFAKNYFGNKCMRCGYNRCKRALEFHEKIPRKGMLTPALKFRSLSKKNIRKLLDSGNFILLCTNCHREVEEGSWTLE